LGISFFDKIFPSERRTVFPSSLQRQHLTISDDLPTRIITGAVQVKPDIREFTPNGIIWADGSVTEGVQNVVMATGYLFDFGLVEEGKLIPVEENHARLWKNMLAPDLAKCNSLAIIGLVQPSGAILPTAEMQANST
jgi:dimethylaniline monooxygenase (N-oxide forming)